MKYPALKKIRSKIKHRLFVLQRKWHCHRFLSRLYPKKPLYRRALIVFLAFLILASGIFIFFRPPQVSADWFDDSWLYRQIIAITNSGTAQTDFQTMVTLDSTTLVTAGKIQSDCDDIRVTDISGKLLSHWMEPGTCNTSATKIWVKIPSIPASGANIYLYYGNPAAISTSSTTNTFVREISGVQGAWDMDEATWTNDCSASTVLDSSGNAYHGKSCPNADGTQPTTGRFGNGGNFDGINDYVNAGNRASLTFNHDYTVSIWIRPTILGYPLSACDNKRAVLWTRGAYPTSGVELTLDNAGSLGVFHTNGSGTLDTAGGVIQTGNWYNVVVKFNQSSLNATIYVNGNNVATGAMPLPDASTQTFYITRNSANCGAAYFTGLIDSVHVYNKALSTNEISDLYGTGGDRQGYVTANYPNKSLVRKYSASVSAGSPSSEERGPGPVAYWKFDEGYGQTANDSAASNSGTLGSTINSDANDPTWQSEDMCVTGKCLKFDGINDYVNVPNAYDINNYNSGVTVELWFKTNSVGTAQGQLGQNGPGFLNFWMDSGSGHTHLRWETDDGQNMNSITKIYPNVWYHAIGVYDTSLSENKSKLYINGFLDNQGNQTFTTSKTANISIGSFGGTNYPFNGLIDDVRIYPYARTAAQIKTDYAARGTVKGIGTSLGKAPQEGNWMTNGLVGYWKMDEASWNGTAGEVIDSSGAGNNGVAAGATHKPTTGAGKFGNGGIFDGIDDYMDAGIGSSLNIANAITIETWFKTVSSSEDILGKFSVPEYSGYGLYIQNGKFRGHANNGSAYFYSTNTGPSVNDSNWHHGVMVVNLTNITTYVDGVITGTPTSFTGPMATASNPLYIGKNIIGLGNFTGSIDDVHIYNRALSPKEIRDLYGFAPGPVGHWKMDEKVSGDSKTLNDSSGYGNNGTTHYGANATGMNCAVTGKFGGGCQFDGVDDYISASGPVFNDNVTLEAWFKSNDVSSNQIIVTKWRYQAIDLNINSGSLRSTIVTNNGITDNWWNGSGGTLANNIWYHAAVVYSSSLGYGKLYLNGIDIANINTNSYPLRSGETNTRIGKYDYTPANFFNGSIDDVRVYNYARTASQIAEDYAAGAGRKQPIGHWKFDEGYGTTANNSGIGGSGLNGILTGMSSPATATSGWTDSGKIGKGLIFNGVDNYVDVGNNTALNITDAITVETWAKPLTSRLVAVANDSECSSCSWTVGDCHNWWINELTGRGINAVSVTKNDIDTLAEMKQYPIILNPYGERYPETTGTTILDNIRQYVAAGGYWFESGGWNFYYSCGSAADLYSGGDDHVCVNIGGSTTESRDLSSEGITKLGAGMPGAVTGSARASFGTSAGYSECQINTKYYQLYNKTAGNGSGPSMHCYGSGNGCVVRTDDTNTNVATIYAQMMKSYPESIGKMDAYAINFDNENLIGKINNNQISTSAETGWNHIIMTYDKNAGSNQQKIYVNGGLKAQNTLSETINTNTNNLIIGKYPSGSIGDVRIYNYALTEDEVREEYNSGVATKLGSTGTSATGTPDNSQNREYCVPGDTSTCNPPVAHWNFDEKTGTSANDISGNANTGTLGGGTEAYRPAWISGKIGGGLQFDGVNDYINAGNGESLRASQISGFAWIKPSVLSSVRIGIFSNGNIATYGTNNYILETYNDTIRVYGRTPSSPIISSSVLIAGQWQYVGFINNGSITKIYRNGVEIGSGSQTLGIDNTFNHYIGAENAGGGSMYFFNGSIDDVRVYNYARTPAQIAWDYNHGKPVAQWKFDECQGATAYDASGNSNNGTITIGAGGTQTAPGTCTSGSSSAYSWGNGATGKYNSAMNFDGVDDYVDAGNGASLNITENITIAAWTKRTSTGYDMIVGKLNAYLLGFNYNNTVYFNYHNGTSWAGASFSQTAITDQNWHYILATYSQSRGTVQIFIDGKLDKETSVTADNITTNTNNLRIGYIQAWANEWYFNGLIDDVSVYNYALTPLQIKDAYNSGAVNFR